MAESNDKPRILIPSSSDLHLSNADFEKKAGTNNTPPEKETQTKAEIPPIENPFLEQAENVALVVAGAVASKVVSEIREKLHGAKEAKTNKEEPKTPEKEKKLDFTQIEDRLFGDKNLGAEEKKKTEILRQERIDEFIKIDGGTLVRDITTRIHNDILPNNDWDNVYVEMVRYARNIEAEIENRSGIPDRLNGVALAAINYEANRVLERGLQSKAQGMSKPDFQIWLDKKNKANLNQYTEDEIVEIKKLSKRSFVKLAPDNPEEFVGKSIRKEDDSQNNNNEDLERRFQEFKENTQRMIDAMRTNNLGITIDMLREAMGQGNKEDIKRLYREYEKDMSQIPSGLEIPKFLVGEHPDILKLKVPEWQARGRLSSACFMKRMAKGPDELGQNTEAQAITNEQLELLLKMPGVLETVSLESYLIVSKLTPWTLVNRAERTINLDDNDKIRNLPIDLNQIKEGKQLEAFREAKIQWLMACKNLNRETAEDAEVVSRNLIYLANVNEDYDSRYQYQNGIEVYDRKYKFISPTVPQFKSLNAWQLMHPQERLQAKTETGNEAWSLFGTYAFNKFKTSKAVLDLPILGSAAKLALKIPILSGVLKKAGLGWSVSSEQFYPTRLIPNTFEFDEDGDEETFMKTFLENGKKLIDNPNSNLAMPNFEETMGEGPFAGYCFLKLSPASTIFNIITNPGKFDRNWATLGNALRSCDVPAYYREQIVLGIHGVVPGMPFLTPKGGIEAYLGTKSAVKATDPNFFN